MSSARAVRCRLKCHNERNPCCWLPSGNAGHSSDTAIVRCEEGGDDVKSARPLRPGLHTCYNGRHSGKPPCEGARIPKAVPSSDWSLQPDSTKPDSLVIAHQPWRGEYVPGPCNKVAVPEGAAGTPPFWSAEHGVLSARAFIFRFKVERGHRFRCTSCISFFVESARKKRERIKMKPGDTGPG